MVSKVEYMMPADQEKKITPHFDRAIAMKTMPIEYTNWPQI